MANLRANKITSTEVFETTGSVQFDGNGDYLSLADSNDWNYSTGDFTIEFWYYFNSLPDSDGQFFYSQRVDGGNYNFIFATNTKWEFDSYESSSQGPKLTFTTTHNLSTWNHLAVTRSGNTFRLFVNGVESATQTNSDNLPDLSAVLEIGRWTGGPSRYVNGHISNLRILKGTALYTKNFTPPTRELTVIPNTVLLACTSTTRANEEKTGKTITVNGNAVANELTPGLLTDRVKSGGTSAITGSVEFSDGGDFLQIVRGSNTDFQFGTQDFTIEFFAHFAKTGMRIMSTGDNGNYTTGGWVFETNNQFGAATSSGTFTYFGTFTYPINSWAHISVVRNGSNIYGFVNGVQQWSNTISTNITFSGTNDFSLGTGRSGSSGVGNYNLTASTMTKGFISNLRVIKGTALYTSNFIPPTRELKNIPGTVLLCCKNTSDPTAEETGKTITPFGSLVYNPPELVNDGAFNSASSWPSAQADWSISGGKATINSANSGYDYLGILTSRTINGLLYELRFDISSWTAGRLELAQSDSSNIGVTVSGNGSYSTRFRYTGTTNGNISLYSYTDTTASFALDNLSLKQVASVPSPPFTPPIGSDGSVTFDGVTKINTPNYFYLPTGTTEQRDVINNNYGARGILGGGYNGSVWINSLQYVTIATTGNALDFGDLSSGRAYIDAVSSSTRGVFGGGEGNNTMDYITIASTGNAQDFGDSTSARRDYAGCSSLTRGLFGGGQGTNIIDYITIASTGNAQDFGDLTQVRYFLGGCSSPTRGVFAGGDTGAPAAIKNINYVTISSTGNAQTFGDLTISRSSIRGCSNSVRGVFSGGYTLPGSTNIMDYITISSTGTATDFGDMITARGINSAISSSLRGLFTNWTPSTGVSAIDYVNITSTSNALDFGDTITQAQGGCSNGHGGLG